MKTSTVQSKIKNAWMYLSMIICVFCISIHAKAANEISVTATGGTTGPTLYSSLTDAGGVFAAINAGTHQGLITISITGSESAETGINALNASGSGSASYTSISIQPIGGVAVSISGNVAGPMITFNAANHVTIDGLNAGGNSLSISNSDSGTSASTIRFLGVTNSTGAANNTIQNSTITGAGTGNVRGTVFFDAGLNTNNTINNCIIASLDSIYGLATNAIYEAGSSAADNSSNSIIDCNISDYFNAASSSYGMLITNDCSSGGWIVTGNRFYQTNTRTSVGGSSVIYGAISIGGTGNGWIVADNIIGYANDTRGGTTIYTCDTGTVALPVFRAIQVLGAGISEFSNVNSNIISDISFTTNSVATAAPGIFNAVYSAAAAGLVNIGSTSSTGNRIRAISLSSNNTGKGKTGIFAAGIYATSSAASTVHIQGDTLTAIACQAADTTSGYNFRGIYTAGTAGFTVSDNIVGDTAANDIYAGTVNLTSALQTVCGIQVTNTGSVAVQNNVVRNLTSYCNIGILGKTNTASNTMSGIVVSAGTGIDVSHNSVSYLTVNDTTGNGTTNSAGSITINGISVGSAGNTVSVQSNAVTNLNAYGWKHGNGNGNGAGTTLNGILVTAGSVVTVSNNTPISGLTGNSSSTGTVYTVANSTINGIAISAASTSATVTNNTAITNLNAISVGSSNGRSGVATVNGISVAASGSPVVVRNNGSFSNFDGDSHSNSNGGSGTANVNGIIVTAASVVTVNSNTSLSNLTADSYEHSNGGAGTSNVNGVLVSSGTSVTIDSNTTIHRLTANSYETSNGGSGPSNANGISVTVASGIININANSDIDSVTAYSYQSGSFSSASTSNARGISVSGAPSGNITIDGNENISSVLADSHCNNGFGVPGISNASGIFINTGAGVGVTNNSVVRGMMAKSYSTANASSAGGPASAYGINVTTATGAVSISGNTIAGDTSDAHGGAFASYAKVYGISVSSTGAASTSDIYGNSINGLTAIATGTNVDTATVFGIVVSSGTAATIGHSALQGGNSISSLTATSSSPGTLVRGISVTSGTPTIQNNLISTLSSTTKNAGTGAGDAMIGILSNVAATGQVIDGNIVSGLKVTGTPSTAVNIDGILTADTGSAGNVTKNNIYSLSNTSSSATSSVNGIHASNGVAGGWNIVNNMIALNDTDAAALVNGILHDGGDCNVYFNSVYISGNATAHASYALQNADTTAVVNIKDNILINKRGIESTQNNYAIGYTSAANWLAANSDFNDLFSSGINTGNAAGTSLTWPNWSPAIADANSLNSDVSASFANATTADLHLPDSVMLNGTSLSPTWVTDYDGEARGATPRMGADEILITGTATASVETFSMYPNPANSQLTVYGLQFTVGAMLEIYDVLGEKVYNGQLLTSDTKAQIVDVSKLPSGLYFVEVQDAKGKRVAKFIKE